jgi:hypothetical protein
VTAVINVVKNPSTDCNHSSYYNEELKMRGNLKIHFKLEHMRACSVRQYTGTNGEITMWICKLPVLLITIQPTNVCSKDGIKRSNCVPVIYLFYYP